MARRANSVPNRLEDHGITSLEARNGLAILIYALNKQEFLPGLRDLVKTALRIYAPLSDPEAKSNDFVFLRKNGKALLEMEISETEDLEKAKLLIKFHRKTARLILELEVTLPDSPAEIRGMLRASITREYPVAKDINKNPLWGSVTRQVEHPYCLKSATVGNDPNLFRHLEHGLSRHYIKSLRSALKEALDRVQ